MDSAMYIDKVGIIGHPGCSLGFFNVISLLY